MAPSKDNRLPLVVAVVVPTTVGLETDRAGGLGTEPVVNEIVSDKLEPAELVACTLMLYAVAELSPDKPILVCPELTFSKCPGKLTL